MDDGLSGILKDLQAIVEQTIPSLPIEELSAFVEHYFSRRDQYLAILERHPTPVYILESSVLKERARRFQNAFDQVLPRLSYYYAVKSNNHPDVSRALIQSGFGLDVSSGVELEMAVDLGSRDMVFSGPGKTDQELSLAVKHADSVTVLLDSFGELHRLENIASSRRRNIKAGVRLTTDQRGLWRKFGIRTEDLPAFWKEAQQCTYTRLSGLQFHTSWNLSPRAQIEFLNHLGKALRSMPPSFREAVAFIDIGGGYWPTQGEWLQKAGTPAGRLQTALGKEAVSAGTHYRLPSTCIETFAEQLGEAIRTEIFPVVPCRICLEPGRWICNDAMHLFVSVVDKKAPDLVIADAGTNAIGWERFETDYAPVLNLTRPSVCERPCHIFGSLCTPHDVWGYSYWGEDIRAGDILMIPTQGAYTYSLRQNFIKPLPPVVVV